MARPHRHAFFHSPVNMLGTVIVDLYLLGLRVQPWWIGVFFHFPKEGIEIQAVRIVCFGFIIARPYR